MKKTVAQQVADALVTDILCRTYAPGQILSERMLMEAYGCSKTTIREVLVGLISARVLRSIPRMGYEVIWVEAKRAQEILQVRYILETSMLRLSAGKATPEALARLRALNEKCRDAERMQDILLQWDCCAAFHLELMELSQSDYARWSLEFALGTLKIALVQSGEASYGSVFDEGFPDLHDDIIDALERGDVDAACEALKEDLWLYQE